MGYDVNRIELVKTQKNKTRHTNKQTFFKSVLIELFAIIYF